MNECNNIINVQGSRAICVECSDKLDQLAGDKNVGQWFSSWASTARYRHKDRDDIEVTITGKDIATVFPHDLKCPIMGIKFKRNTKGNCSSHFSPTLDRIDPTKGYTPGNIQVISQLANQMKADAQKKYLLRFAQYVIANNGNMDTRV